MHKQLFFIILLYLIIYSFSAETDPCEEHEEESECNEDTTNNCEWTDTKECEAATCTGLKETPCKAIASCKWDSTNGCGDTTDACTGLTAATSPTCAASTYCVWTAAVDNTPASCAAVDCTKLDGTDAACTGAKGCSLTVTGGTCAKKSSNNSGGNGGSTGSDSAFGLKTSLTLLIIGFLL
jgi:hypothetical protein